MYTIERWGYRPLSLAVEVAVLHHTYEISPRLSIVPQRDFSIRPLDTLYPVSCELSQYLYRLTANTPRWKFLTLLKTLELAFVQFCYWCLMALTYPPLNWTFGLLLVSCWLPAEAIPFDRVCKRNIILFDAVCLFVRCSVRNLKSVRKLILWRRRWTTWTWALVNKSDLTWPVALVNKLDDLVCVVCGT